MITLTELKAQQMKDHAFREEYTLRKEQQAVLDALVETRVAAGLTQAEVARRIDTTRSEVARLEGGWVSPTLMTVLRYARAVNVRLDVEIARLPADDGELAPEPTTAGMDQVEVASREGGASVVTSNPAAAAPS